MYGRMGVLAWIGAALLFSSVGLHAADKPNVIFIAVDDLNNWTGFAGHPDAITPNMDALASEGVRFSRAYCSYPLCGPSRASLMSGVYFSELNLSQTQPDDAEVKLKVEALGSSLLHTYLGNHGYKTMAVGKILHNHVPSGSVDLSGGRKSWDYNENASGTRVRSNWPPDLNPDTAETLTDWGLYVGDNAAGTEADMSDSIAANWAVARLQETHTEPFMLMVGFLHPHVPWYAPQKYYDMYDPATLTLPPYNPDDFNDIPSAGLANINDGYPRTEWAIANNQWRNMVHAYLANITYADAKIGLVLDALKNSPYASNTVVVLWGDHGYHMGEKNTFQKHTLWERSGVTPLVIKAPGMAANAECNSVVSLLDIYPTLLDLCDLPPNDKVRGRSLKPLLQAPATPWNFPAFTYKGGTKAVQHGNLRYIGYEDGSQELYDHSIDPNEWTNRVNDPNYAGDLAELQNMSPFPEEPTSDWLFEFTNGSSLDNGNTNPNAGIGGNMTVGSLTLTTHDIIGQNGSRCSAGVAHRTNIGTQNGLGINSSDADKANNFDAGEGWEFKFNSDVQLSKIDLQEAVVGGTLTISSAAFPDIVLTGAVNGVNDLGAVFVPANTVIGIYFTHTSGQGTDGPKIMSLAVIQGSSAAWNVDANGTWADVANWNPALVPGSTTIASPDTASFTFPPTAADRTVTVDTSRFIGGIDFENVSGFGYTLSGGTLNMNDGGAVRTLAGNGAHIDKITARIVLDASATFTANANSASSTMELGDNVSGGWIKGSSITDSVLTLNGTNTGLNRLGWNSSNANTIIANGTGHTLAIVKDGPGTWWMGGKNASTGGLTVKAGTLVFGGGRSDVLGLGPVTLGDTSGGANNATLVSNASGLIISRPIALAPNTTGILTLGGGVGVAATTYSGGVSGANHLTLESNGALLTMATNAVNHAGALTVKGTGNTEITSLVGPNVTDLTKTAAGTLTLSANNTYTGPTHVGGGTLLIHGNQSAATGAVTVGEGATLGGTGIVGGTVTTSAVSATIAPGNPTGVFSVASADLSAGGTLAIDIDDGADPKNARLVVAGTLTLGGATSLSVSAVSPAEPAYIIASYGSLVGTFTTENIPPGYEVDYHFLSEYQIALVSTTNSVFQDWISTKHPTLIGDYALPSEDPDKDGVDNLREFALNGDPTSGSNSGVVYSTTLDANGDAQKELVMTIAVRNSGGSPVFTAGTRGERIATVDGLVYSVEGSHNLTHFTSAVSEVTPPVQGPLPPPPPGWEYRSFRLDASQGLPAGLPGFMWVGVAEEVLSAD